MMDVSGTAYGPAIALRVDAEAAAGEMRAALLVGLTTVPVTGGIAATAADKNGRDPDLTDREERILQLLSATHLSQREMARELGISLITIKSHVKAIYVKLGATSREEASQIARNHGLMYSGMSSPFTVTHAGG